MYEYNNVFQSTCSKINIELFPRKELKGTMSRDFCFWFFFMNQFPPSPRVSHLDRFECFQKFVEIFASQGASLVSTTSVSTTPASATPGVSFATSFTSVVNNGGKFATGVNDNGGKFAADVNDTGGN
jgi:hypothetical protein